MPFKRGRRSAYPCWARITKLTKELEQKAEEMNKVEQAAYDLGQKETATHLKSQILVVCQDFCPWTWNEALNAVGVDPSSELRNPEKVFYPPTIREKTSTPIPLSTTAFAQPVHVEDQPPASIDKAPTNSTTAKEIPSLEKVPSLVETTFSGPQPSAEGQITKDAEKEKEPESQGK